MESEERSVEVETTRRPTKMFDQGKNKLVTDSKFQKVHIADPASVEEWRA